MASKKTRDDAMAVTPEISTASEGMTKASNAGKTKDKEKVNVHAGHRSRMKAQARENGLDAFNPHQVLELLLFYSIPQRDTNAIAHELISKFGSLSKVLDAKYDALLQVNGVSENTATFLNLLPQVARLYMIDQGRGLQVFTSRFQMGTFLMNYYIGVQVETPILLLMNERAEMIAPPVIMSAGTQNRALFDVQTVAQHAVKHGASVVALAHNHPSDYLEPSVEDIMITKAVRSGLETLNIKLFEHFIVGRTGYSMSSEWKYNTR